VEHGLVSGFLTTLLLSVLICKIGFIILMTA